MQHEQRPVPVSTTIASDGDQTRSDRDQRGSDDDQRSADDDQDATDVDLAAGPDPRTHSRTAHAGCTFTLGLACSEPGETLEGLITRADLDLLEARRAR